MALHRRQCVWSAPEGKGKCLGEMAMLLAMPKPCPAQPIKWTLLPAPMGEHEKKKPKHQRHENLEEGTRPHQHKARPAAPTSLEKKLKRAGVLDFQLARLSPGPQ
eukprot:3681894-Amphidinium_carterae.1